MHCGIILNSFAVVFHYCPYEPMTALCADSDSLALISKKRTFRSRARVRPRLTLVASPPTHADEPEHTLLV